MNAHMHVFIKHGSNPPKAENKEKKKPAKEKEEVIVSTDK